jgi:hypothetical protein
MWKEFILLLLLAAVGYVASSQLPKWWKERKAAISRRTFVKQHTLLQFILLFLISGVFFFLLAVVLQHVGLSPFILSVKYDLLPFFIFGLGMCLGIVIFTEKDKELFQLYKKLMVRCLWGGLFRRLIVYMTPNFLRHFGYNWENFEGTIGAHPPAAYYTLVKPNLPGSYVRNQFLFERPISFGFWLIAFFPVFVLSWLRKKNLKNQIFYTIGFGLLVFSTRSRAGIAIFAVEVVALLLLLHRKVLKKWLRGVIALGVLSLGGIGYLGTSFFAREHSNTGHLVLLMEGWNIAKEHLLIGWGAGYSGPASHQLCYDAPGNPRCETLQAVNEQHSITTYGFNPENQYLQILMEYGSIGLLCWGAMLCWILRYTAKMVRTYRKKEKSAYQQFLRRSLIGFGIGLLGLCGEGLVLHSLVDRMIVYPFFLLYGLALGSWERVKDEVFIPEISEQKKKSAAKSGKKKAEKKGKSKSKKSSKRKKGKRK